MKRYTDLSTEDQAKAVQFYLQQLDLELVEQAPTQANTVAERRAKRTLYIETTDNTVLLPAIQRL